jgi:DNA-binding GntR family transcriptional regulator
MISGNQPALEEVMGHLAALMQRLLEIQSGGRQRNPKLIAEHEQLMDDLKKRAVSAAARQMNNTTEGNKRGLRRSDRRVCAS